MDDLERFGRKRPSVLQIRLARVIRVTRWPLGALIVVAALGLGYWTTSKGYLEQLTGGDDRSLLAEGQFFAQYPYGLIDPSYYSESALTTTHYMPMYYLYFLVIGSIAGDDATAYYAFGFVVHALNALLLFYLVFAMTRRVSAAATAAALFLLFPGNVETLRWVASALNHPPVVFFMLVTLLAYRRYRHKGSRLFYVFAVFLYLLGCLNKQTFYPFFTVLIAYDYLVAKERFRVGRFLKVYAPFVVCTLVFLVIQLYRFKYGWIHQYKGGLLLHPLVFVRLLDFAKLFVWPFPVESDPWVAGLILGCFAALLYAIIHTKDQRIRLGALWIVLLGILSMTQNLRSVSENIRYNYVMLPGFALLMSSVLLKKWVVILPFVVAGIYVYRLLDAY